MFRHPNDKEFKAHYIKEHEKNNINIEWSPEYPQRDDEDIWKHRYEYESKLIIELCEVSNNTKILELGSGPGYLGQLIIKDSGCQYTFMDKPYAGYFHKKRDYKGTFIIANMLDGLDTTQLESDYDIIIANDFLEHVANPSNIIRNTHRITKPDSLFFISVPNWRMGHDWIYRGLFDYDNWLYFMYTHGYEAITVSPSFLQTPDSPKTQTESMMPDELRTSWNWYFLFKKMNNI